MSWNVVSTMSDGPLEREPSRACLMKILNAISFTKDRRSGETRKRTGLYTRSHEAPFTCRTNSSLIGLNVAHADAYCRANWLAVIIPVLRSEVVDFFRSPIRDDHFKR